MSRPADVLFAILVAVGAQGGDMAPRTLPVRATQALEASLQAAARHTTHLWRDTVPVNADGTITAYIEIARGDRRKWEFDMAAHARAIDRIIPEAVGGYPVNYGFVPQTVSYDGDPFDALVLGPPLPGGRLVRGIAVGIMFMEDEKGLDSKIVLSPVSDSGQPLHPLTPAVQRDLTAYFQRYKRHQPDAFSRVPGWGSADEGIGLMRLTHAFFRGCRLSIAASCTLSP